MSRYERRMYFERLIELRRAYTTLGDEDRSVAMTIDEAIAWVERELDTIDVAGTASPTEIEH